MHQGELEHALVQLGAVRFALVRLCFLGHRLGRLRNRQLRQLMHETYRIQDWVCGALAPGSLSLSATCLAALVCIRSLAITGR